MWFSVLVTPPKPGRPRSASPKRLAETPHCAPSLVSPTSKFQLCNVTTQRHIRTVLGIWKISLQFDFSFEGYLQEDASYSLAGEYFNHDFGQPNASFEDQYYMLDEPAVFEISITRPSITVLGVFIWQHLPLYDGLLLGPQPAIDQVHLPKEPEFEPVA
jgi:hypothetical protein